MVDGDYFNVISRGIDLAGSIAHYQSGKIYPILIL